MDHIKKRLKCNENKWSTNQKQEETEKLTEFGLLPSISLIAVARERTPAATEISRKIARELVVNIYKSTTGARRGAENKSAAK